MTSPLTTAPARRGPSLATSFARLGLFLLVSVVAGVLVAGTALPFVGGAGVATRTAVESFESLPSQLAIPVLPQRSVILASDGTAIATIYEQNRLEVRSDQIAPVMKNAIVAVEDGRFYTHRGVDPKGILRAFVGNSTGGQAAAGGGGSTLTQQYVKNVFVESATTPEEAAAARARTLSRKIKEARYALALERTLSKDQILTDYLNIAYFGAGAYGIEAASLRYFSKHASQLTLLEAATLAGAVQQPVAYDPLRNPKSSQKRRAQVLGRMAELGMISHKSATAAAAVPTTKFLKPRKLRNGCTTSYAPFFCDYVRRVILSDPAFGKTPADRENLLRIGGLRIRTTLDPTIQKAAQEAVDSKIPRRDSSKKVAAITMVRPSTGEVVAMAENRSWGTKGIGVTTYNFNVGTKMGGSAGAAAGSTFKAFTLAAALEKGESPYDYITSPQRGTFEGFKNCKTGVPWGKVTVNNSTGAGTFNMLSGTAFSINTYFMGLEEKITQCAPRDLATRLGLTRGNGSPLQANPTFTLGTDEVTPLGMASAYSVFANHGVKCNPTVIAQVTDRNGKDLRIPLAACKQLVDRKVADSVTSILSQVIDGPLKGRTGAAMSLGRDAAGKTGTTNSSASVWFVGYTPDLAAAVATYDPRAPYTYTMKNITINGHYFPQVFGSSLPGPIWKQAMTAALATTPPTKFDLVTLDGLGVYKPPPPPSPSASAAPGASGSPAPNPSGSPAATPTPGTKPKPKPSPSPKH
ncbi:MAG TPA: transglycosylase domain-containing protein [Candidatus Nanopelagicales bacterium]|nr:transglycosylase domain-containing protein [Candidatus Nanopelagicales bacterium]